MDKTLYAHAWGSKWALDILVAKGQLASANQAQEDESALR